MRGLAPDEASQLAKFALDVLTEHDYELSEKVKKVVGVGRLMFYGVYTVIEGKGQTSYNHMM